MVDPNERNAPAEFRMGPASVPYAVIGIVVSISGALLLLGGLGLAGALSHPPTTDCPLGAPGVLGWAELDVGRMSTIARTHTLSQPGHVLLKIGEPRSQLCTLPRGTHIEVRERPERGRNGTWLAVHGDAVTLPR